MDSFKGLPEGGQAGEQDQMVSEKDLPLVPHTDMTEDRKVIAMCITAVAILVWKSVNALRFLFGLVFFFFLKEYMGDTFQDPQWMPETTYSTEPYIYCTMVFLHIYNYDKV